MDLAAVIIAAILGWRYAALGKRELQVIALVVAGWTAVTTAAAVPYVTIEGIVISLLWHAALVAVPYGTAALVRRIARR